MELASADRVKDREILRFLDDEPAEVRAEWEIRAAFIRVADLLIEGGALRSGDDALGVAAMEYIRAEVDYTMRDLELFTLAAHDEMLRRLGGSAFRLLPYALPHWETIAEFGAYDQLMNDLRDLHEDLPRGLCYFPTEVLRQHGLSRAEVLDASTLSCARRWPHWHSLMRFWFVDYAPQVQFRARPFIRATNLHPSLARFRAECLARHERIKRVFREVEFDYRAFPARYWAEER